MQRWIGPAVAGLIVIGAGALWLQRAIPVASAPMPPTGVAGADADTATRRAETTPGSSPAVARVPAAPSWSGTAVDGDIHLDARRNVIPDRALRDLFDYLLTARGELSLDEIKQRLAAVGQAHPLAVEQLGQLAALFNRYLDYLDALPHVALQGRDIDSMRRTYEARHALRQGMLGIEMAEGFFAEDEQRDRYEIATLAIRRDPALSPEARAGALAELRQTQAPAALRDVDQRSATVIDLAAETERLRAAGASGDAIQVLRERTVGSEAADRLAVLDAQRAQWQLRVETMRGERDRIFGNTALAPSDRQQQVDAMIARDFSEEEAVRLRAQLGSAASPSSR